MRIILHIGMPKSGSTALQDGLRRNDHLLRQRGFLYPARHGLPKNHNLLIAPLIQDDGLPRVFKQVYKDDPKLRFQDVRRMLAEIGDRAKRDGIHTIVLSGEMLFRPLSHESASNLRRMLQPLAEHITVVAYVRSPSGFYLSMAQQVLKANSSIPIPRGKNYRATIECYERFADSMIVRLYDRDSLAGGDIMTDFLGGVLAFGAHELDDIVRVRSNHASSAEVMDAFHRYKSASSLNDNEYTPDGKLVRHLLEEADRKLPAPTKPVLHQHIVDAINGTCPDAGWLKERWNIVFPDFDYSMSLLSEGPSKPPARVRDICSVNEDRTAALLSHALHSLALQKPSGNVSFGTAFPNPRPTRPRPSRRRRLLNTLLGRRASG